MTEYIIDAYSWIEYFDGSSRGVKVKNVIENPKNRVHTCAVTIAEIVSKFLRRNFDPEIAYKAIIATSHVIAVDEKLSFLAGQLHAGMRKHVRDFGLADAYLLACAKNYKAKIVTGDPHFKNIRDVVLI
jgi:predicted nucleic acid-binding protein